MTWVNSRRAVSLADGSLGNGKKCAILLTVYHGQYGGVAAGRWQTGNSEMWDQGRRGTGSGCRRPAGAWSLGLCWLQVGRSLWCPLPGRTARSAAGQPPWFFGFQGELKAVGPLQNLGPEVRWHEQTIGGQAGAGLVLDGGLNSLLHLPGECGQTGGWKDGVRAGRESLQEVPRQSVRLDVAGPRPVREGKVKPGEEEQPASLSRVKTSGRQDIF